MTTKDKRREFRLAASEDDLLVEAAGLVGVSVTEFVVGRAISEAETVVEVHHNIRLSEEALADFLAVLDAPPRRLERLAKQARRARRLKRGD